MSSDGAARPGHYKATHTQLIHKRSPVSINATSEPSGVRPSDFVLLIHLLQTTHIFMLSQAHGVLQTSCTLPKQISCNCGEAKSPVSDCRTYSTYIHVTVLPAVFIQDLDLTWLTQPFPLLITHPTFTMYSIYNPGHF